MSYRRWILVIIHLSLLFHFSRATVFAQDELTTADQVIARYRQAIGADRFSSITTFEKRGDLYGNITNFWQGSGFPGQAQNKQRGTFEFYFKAPNLRFSSTLGEKNVVLALHGCDGKVSWYIDSYLKPTTLTGLANRSFSGPAKDLPPRTVGRAARLRRCRSNPYRGREYWRDARMIA